ncbi:MAG TPA: ChrR family anti-sigma-E factor [Steroidobacteraceae bacterium]|nr:ChrR family anti-sigma-E factor [Steroidobacteraceae bacterium]
MIQHHPGDDLLLPLAAGRLSAGQALVVSTHLEGCAECRARLHELQALGGALLEQVEPAQLEAGAWERTLRRIDRPGADAAPATPAREPHPPLPPGVPWPASLHGCRVSAWRWMGPGMRFARVTVPHDPAAALYLLRIGEGRSVPRHTHGGVELTQVLCGAFDDGRARFGPGDFDAADDSVHHQPAALAGATCVCLAYVGAPMRFDGRIASTIGRWIGM